MAKKKATKKEVAKREEGDGVSKTGLIRAALKAHPRAKPKAIAEELQAAGHDIDAQYVSTIKSNDKKKKGGPKGEAANGRRKGAAPGSDNVSLATLVEVKKIAEKVGGVQKLRQHLEALAKLG